MKNRPTVKQEIFAQIWIVTGNACEAYRQAYSCENMAEHSIHVEASRVLRNPVVSLRIDELWKASSERNNVTVDNLTRQLQDVADHAARLGKVSAAVSALTAIGKLHGLVVDHTKMSGGLENITPPTINFSEKKLDEPDNPAPES